MADLLPAKVAVGDSSAWLGRLHPEARRTALFVLLCFFAVGVPRIFTTTAAITIFLNVYGAEFLPYIYIGAACAAPAVGFLYLRLQARLPFKALLLATLAADLVVLAALRLGFMLTDLAWLAVAAAIWVEVEWMLVSLVFWGLAERAFNIRQAKRLFGVIGSGEPVAIILGGLAVPVLLATFETADLFWLSAAGLSVGIVLILYIDSAYGDQIAEETVAEEETSIEHGRSGSRSTSRYLALIFTAVVLSEMAYYFIDNAFFDRAGARFPEEGDLAGFIGAFYAAAALVTLACNLFVSGRLLRRYGVQAGLLLLPVLLVAASLSVLVAGLAFGAVALVFWLTALAKLVDEGFRSGVYRPAMLTLYQPLPPEQRTKAQTWVEGFCGQFAAGAAGLILLLLTGVLGLGVAGLFAAAVVLLVGCAAVLVLLHREYVVVLSQAVAKRRFNAEVLSVEDEETLEVVKKGLASPRPGEVLYCMHLLEAASYRPLEPLLVPLLDHPTPEIRGEVLRRIEHLRLRDAREAVRARLLTEPDPGVRGAAVRALAAVGEAEDLDLLIEYSADADEAVRLSALTGLMLYGGIEGVVAVGERFMAMVRSSNPGERRMATRVLEELGSSRFYRPLRGLLNDPDPEVQRAALKAAAAVNAPELLPLLREAVRVPSVGQAAAVALAAAGEAVLPALEELYARPDSTSELRTRIIWIYGHVGGTRASALLEAKLDIAEPRIQRQVLMALRRCGVCVTAANRSALWSVVRNTVGGATWVSAALADLGGGEGEAIGLLRRALEHELLSCRERIFLALSFFYDEEMLACAWQEFVHGTPDKRAYALEIVDTLLSPELRALVLPILEPPVESRTARPRVVEARQRLERRLEALVRNEAGLASPWIRSCALYCVGQLAERRAAAAVAAALDADEALVRETAAWALSRLHPGDLRERVEPLAPTSLAQAASLA